MIRTDFKENTKSHYKQISRYLILFWWILSLSLLIVLLTFDRVKISDSVILYIGLWLLMISGFMIFVSRWSFSARLGRPFDILEIPIYLGLTSLFLIYAFGLAPYFDIKYLRILPSVSYIPSGLILTGSGFFSMLLGYTLISRSHKTINKKSTNRFTETPSLRMSIIVYTSLLILRWALIALGGGEMILRQDVVRVGGDWYQWLEYLIELRWFFIALVTLQVFNGRWPRRFFYFIVLIEATMAIISGWSSLLPKIIVLVFGCLIYTKHKLPWRTLFSVAIIIIAFIIFSIPITRHLRFSEHVTISKVNDAIKATWGEGLDNGWNIFSDLLISRQTVIAQTPSILLFSFPDSFSYLPLQELIVAPITFIPRIMWPSKPNYSQLYSWLTVNVFGGSINDGSSAVTIAGNAYMYGGWPVAMIGMFILGIVASLFYKWLAIPGLMNNRVGLLAVYAGVVIANFQLGEGDFVSIWQGLIQRTVVFLAMAWILDRKVGPFRNSS